MKAISLLISLFDIIKTKALECVSVVNQKCMPRPKILDVNEGIGEALFYPYNVLVNKCSGSCNTLEDPMAKLCVPNVIKRVNMQVYNFLIRLNETRNVLWHESCKCNVIVCQYVIANKFGIVILVDAILMKILLAWWVVIKGTRGIQALANANATCGVNQVNI